MDTNYLIYLASKKIETTMIGALSRFEESFGHLWAQNKNDHEDLTELEAKMDDLWQFTRNSILDHGNKQIRSLSNEIKKLQNPEVKYHYKFNPRNN